MRLRIIFMGSPDFSVPLLRSLLEGPHEVVACYSQPPRQAGRGKSLKPTPVQSEAEKHGIPVFTPLGFDQDAIDAFLGLKADVAIVVAYGLLLPEAILNAPTYGCLNIHASLLPRWRGAAPIQRAIMAGDDKTGIMLMKMEIGLDTGPVALCEDIPITADMTASDLHDALSLMGARMIGSALEKLAKNQLTFTPQAETGVTYAQKISKGETRMDWTLAAYELTRHIHGLSPFPGAWFALNQEEAEIRVKVMRVRTIEDEALSKLTKGYDKITPGLILDEKGIIATADGAIELIEVQRAGKERMDGPSFMRGLALKVGDNLIKDPLHESHSDAAL